MIEGKANDWSYNRVVFVHANGAGRNGCTHDILDKQLFIPLGQRTPMLLDNADFERVQQFMQNYNIHPVTQQQWMNLVGHRR